MPDAALPRDPSGGVALGVTDDSSGYVIPVHGDDDSKSMRIANLVWDADDLEWVKMTQPVINTDEIEINTDVLEQEVLDLLAHYHMSDWLVDGTNIYIGYLTKTGAWYIKKVDTSNHQIRYISGSSGYSFADPASLSYDDFATEF